VIEEQQSVTTPHVPLLSVAIVCFNARTYLQDAIDSVLCQPFDDYELVIIDGGSTDGTLDLIAKAAKRGGCVRWTSEPDSGIYDAMNKAIHWARGSYLLFLGADDLLEPGALDAIARAVGGETPPDIVCGATRVFGDDGRAWDEAAREVVRRGMAQRAPARHQSIAVRRALLERVGGFDTSFPIAADYELYLRLIEAGASVSLVPERLSRFRLGGVSSEDATRTAREYARVRIAHGASPFVERVVSIKSILAAKFFAVFLARRGTPGEAG